jgi:NADH-quinone oxidoreductase subunit M
MNFLKIPWLELQLLLPLVGAVAAASFPRAAGAARWTLGFMIVGMFIALGGLAAHVGVQEPGRLVWGQFQLDGLVLPMLPVLSALHFLSHLGTSKSRMTSRHCVTGLVSMGLTSAAVTCQSPWLFVGILYGMILLPLWDLRAQAQPIRGFVVYMVPFMALLGLGGWSHDPLSRNWSMGFLGLALMIFAGIVPLHGWLPGLFQRASLGTAMLLVLPMVEVVGVLRFLIPQAPEWMLKVASMSCLVTAIYSAGMGIIQAEPRRFLAFLVLSQTSLVMFAVMMQSATSITAALCLWISVSISLAGLGFSIRALEDRFGRLSLREHHGHYDQVPGLAIGFLTAGLASVGFPGTIGFVPMELLVSSSAQQGLGFNIPLAFASMLNGIAILRAYFALFTGKRPMTSVSLRMTLSERWGIVLIAVLIFGAGWFSPSIVESRHRIAEQLLIGVGGRVAPAAELPFP